jgi:uncharacterized protein (TIGR02001 family)
MKIKSMIVASLAAISFVAPAMAQDATVSYNVGVASNYFFRGATQTLDDPQAFGGADISKGAFYAGTWFSNVDFGGDANLEVDLYGGYKTKVGAIDLDLGLLYYAYPGESDINVMEAKVAGTYAFKSGATLTGSYFYSPEYGKDGPATNYVELAGGLPLSAKVGPFGLTAVGSVGYYDLGEYVNYKAAIAGAADKGWGLEVGVVGTDVEDSDPSAYVSLKKSF